jgi:hypothetical protein
MYHGSVVQAHGPGTLKYDEFKKWYYIVTDVGHHLSKVRRSSFTILDEETYSTLPLDIV